MQQQQVAEFFTRLIIVIAFIMALSVIAIPEIVRMVDESCAGPSGSTLWSTGSAAVETTKDNTFALPVAAGPSSGIGLD